MKSYLKISIIRRVFEFIGVKFFVPKQQNEFDDAFKLSRTITIEGEDDSAPVDKPLWGGRFEISSFFLEFIVVDLSSEGETEFALVFRANDMSTYGLRLADPPETAGQFRFQAENSWVNVSESLMSQVLTGILKLSELPGKWTSIEDPTPLVDSLIEFINYGDE